MLKKAILNTINALGYRLEKIGAPAHRPSDPSVMEKALARLKRHLPSPHIIIDGGSAKGDWTQMAFTYWPDAKYLLIDPLQKYYQFSPFFNSKSNIQRVEGAMGNTSGHVEFSVSTDLYGSGIYSKEQGGERVTVPVVTVEQLLTSFPENASLLLKLDTHGYEMEIFEGVGSRWMQIDAIVVEVYGFYVSPTGRLFHQIADYLFEKGFRLFDIVDIMRREKDQAFWQCDAIFLKASHSVFQNNEYA